MDKSSFIYVSYISAAPEKVFKALTDPKATKRGIIEGWPMVLSSLKSLIETGHALPVLWEEAA